MGCQHDAKPAACYEQSHHHIYWSARLWVFKHLPWHSLSSVSLCDTPAVSKGGVGGASCCMWPVAEDAGPRPLMRAAGLSLTSQGPSSPSSALCSRLFLLFMGMMLAVIDSRSL